MAIATLLVAGCSQNEITEVRTVGNPAVGFDAVSYTHLDVYKRQVFKLFTAIEIAIEIACGF